MTNNKEVFKALGVITLFYISSMLYIYWVYRYHDDGTHPSVFLFGTIGSTVVWLVFVILYLTELDKEV